MAFTPIDEQTWERREYLEVFRQTAIYLTAEVDITPLYRHTKARGEKLYPALIWCAAAVLNRHVHFRYGRDEAGRIGIWDVLHPYYTVPRRDAPDLFAMKVTRFMPDYDVFRQDFQADYARAETCGRLLCDETLPPNVCGISAMPGLAFSAFSFGGDPKPDFTPFVLLRKVHPAGDRTVLPVGGEFAHAVNDGFAQEPQAHGMYHGEKVAFGTLVQLVLEKAPQEELEQVLGFLRDTGLPLTLAQLGVKEIVPETLKKVAEAAVVPTQSTKNLRADITAQEVYDAILEADRIGRDYLAR